MPEPTINSIITDNVSDIAGRTTRSGAMMFVAKAMRHGFAFIVNYILLNLLDPSDFGLMRYVTIILAMVNMLNELGFSISLVQKPSLDSDGASASFTIALGSGCLFYFALFFGAPALAQWFGAPLLVPLVRTGGIAVVLGSLSVVQRSLLQRRMRFGAMAVIEVFAGLAGSSVAVVMALRGAGVWSLVVSYLCYSAVSSIAFLIYGGFPGGNYFRLSAARSLWLFGISIIIQRIIDYATTSLDSIAIGKVFGEFSLGIYGVAFDIATLPRLAIGVILSPVVISAFSRIQDNPAQIKSGFLRLTSVVSTISIPFFVIVLAMPDELLSILSMFRKDTVWMSASGQLRILILVGAVYTLSSYPGLIWVSLGKVKLRIVWSVTMMVTMVLTILIGIPFGVTGVCWALLIRAVVLFPALILVNKRVFSISLTLYARQLAPSVLSGSAIFVLLVLFTRIVNDSVGGRDILVFTSGATAGIFFYLILYAAIWKKQFGCLADMFFSIFKRSSLNISTDV